jgi:hypothetical protein
MFAFVVTACRTPAPAEKHPTPGASQSSAATSPSGATPLAAASNLPAWPGDGCQAGVATDGDPKKVLAALAAACAPGMERVGEPMRIGGDAGEARFHIDDAEACLRVLGVATPSSRHVELSVLDADGHALSSSTAPGAAAVVGPKGPVCLGQAGELRVVAHGAGAVVEVWRAGSARDE